MTTPVAIILLAAGSARRMGGRDKLLEAVDGVPLIRRQAEAARDTGWPVLVTVPAGDHPRAAALAGLDVTPVPVPDADQGMAASIRAGVRAAPPGHGLMILPADMPELTGADLARVGEAFAAEGGRKIVRAASVDGRAGHPVVFPPDLAPELLRLEGDTGARAVIARHGPRLTLVPVEAEHALTDLDTPGDWARWRAGRKRR